MQEQRIMTPSRVSNAGERRIGDLPGEKPYMRFRCARCNHCVSPGMFSAEGWEVYKQTELCPDCQG
jgi:hypothetical protein